MQATTMEDTQAQEPEYIFETTNLKIANLGVIEHERKAFFAKNITPIGFKSERLYTSFVHPNRRCVYTNEVLDGGEMPLFRVTCADAPDEPIVRTSSSACWKEIGERIKSLYPERHNSIVSVSGPDKFGLAMREVKDLIDQLPNADKCKPDSAR